MEKIQVFEVLWRYSTILLTLVAFGYIFSYVQINKLRNTETTVWSIFINELHIVSRSIILMFIAFIFVEYMFLVKLGAIDYFKNNPSHNYTDFFNYILYIKNK